MAAKCAAETAIAMPQTKNAFRPDLLVNRYAIAAKMLTAAITTPAYQRGVRSKKPQAASPVGRIKPSA